MHGFEQTSFFVLVNHIVSMIDLLLIGGVHVVSEVSEGRNVHVEVGNLVVFYQDQFVPNWHIKNPLSVSQGRIQKDPQLFDRLKKLSRSVGCQ